VAAEVDRVYVRNDRDGQIHARYRAGTGPLIPPKSCGMDVVSYTFVADLRGVRLDDLHHGCFSATEARDATEGDAA
jgi:hypothetical protein